MRGGLLRMRVHLPCAERTVGVTELRTLLVADVLLRAAEADRAQVIHDVVVPDLPPEQAKVLDRAMHALGVHLPADTAGTVGDSAEVHVFGDKRRGAERGVWIEVGRVRKGDAALPGLHEADDADPLAVRLALLAYAYRHPAALTALQLADADRTLQHWRHRVADWARSPSKPVPEDIRRQARTALADDLGTPAVLNLLRRVDAAPEIADGAKFETFAHLDRVLGLELTHDVGRL